MQGLLSTPNT